MLSPRYRPILPIAALSLAITLLALWLRPLWPVDETRYMTVAWEMWARGDFLVPHLNGAPYSHKPPLLFWLMQLGWAAFGVNDWWPRLVAPLFAAANLFLLARLAHLLWPARQAAAETAAWIAFGSALWVGFATLTMFDMMMVTWTLLGMIGITHAARGALRHGFTLLGIAIGLGVLTKGPVILLHVLPAAVLAPWWLTEPKPSYKSWYLGILGAIGLGAAIALAWAIPAAIHGGAEYRNAIFWGQTAGRVGASFAHRLPWWWYLPVLPLMLFPWLLWAASWRAWWRTRTAPFDSGVRFLLAWMVPVFIAFSFISGKQAQYLLPLFPAFALLTAYTLHTTHDEPRWFDALLPVLAILAVAGAWGYVTLGAGQAKLPLWAKSVGAWPVLIFLAATVLVVLWRRADLVRRVRALALLSVAVIVAAYVGVLPRVAPAFDPKPAALHLAELERTNHPIAHFGKYHGQFHFAGRLKQPFELVDSRVTTRNWILLNPEGRLITYERTSTRSGDADDESPSSPANWDNLGLSPDFSAPYRGGRMQVWSREAILKATEKRGPE
jgi:4-amino-4-deoxy-L-arabinose transferase-like glycosyltransferase